MSVRLQWPLLPLAVSGASHVLLVFNIAALKISIESIVEVLGIGSSAVKSALIAYSLVVAACILVGARLVAVVGSRRIFRGALALFGGAMVAMAASVDSVTLLVAQTVAGAAAALTPASIELIQDYCTGEPRERALAWLSAIHSLSLAPAFLIAGAAATWMSWRATFAVLVLMAAIVYILSERLHNKRGLFPRSAITRQEGVGLALFATSMLFIGLGSDRLAQWGLLRASPDAPFSVLNLSPALLVILCGVFLVKLALVWSRRRCTDGPLVALHMIAAPQPRSTLLSMFSISAVGSGVTFLIPLYVEIVQGRSSWYTALVLIPLTTASFAATVLASRLSGRLSQRTKTVWGFFVVFAGLALLGGVVRNDWSDLWVIVSLAMIGFGEGALTAMLFAGLASVCLREIADDVEPVCDATSHLAAAVGAALAGAIVIGVLGAAVDRQLARDPATANQLRMYLDLNRVAFVSNDRLQHVMERTAATPEQVKNAIRINTDARLLALKLAFFVLAGVTLIGLAPIAREVSHRVPGIRRDSAR